MSTIIIIVCLILSAFFSGIEIAFISSNKVFLEIEKKQQTLVANILSTFTSNPSKFITTMLIGNNICLVVYGFYMGDVIMEILKDYILPSTLILTQTIISSVIVILTAEFLPKVFFQIYANSLIKLLAVPTYIFYMILNPISSLVIGISDFLLIKLFKTKGDEIQSYVSKNELGKYINENINNTNNANENIDSEIQIFQNALEFSHLYTRDIMTPRTELAALEMHDSIEELKEIFIKTGYSKILIYKTTIDDIVGYVHSFGLLKNPRNIKSIMIPVEYVPETMYIKDLLNILIKKRKSIGVILDEYGGTSGIITLEDIVEELFGDIEDEHDEDEFIEQELENGEYLLSSRLEVAYLNETYNFNLPESESYTTLGGYIVDATGEIPAENEKINIGNHDFIIVEASNKKIETVKILPSENK
jgi:putative hemolysin